MSQQWWPTNPKSIYPVIPTLCDFVPVLHAVTRKSSDLPEFNQTHNAAMFSSNSEMFALQVHQT